jgi:hypothetical protein
MIIKKMIVLILVGSISFQINSMKRSFEEGILENPFKKAKTGEYTPRESLFSFLEKNDLEGFKQEAEWRKLHDKDSLNERNNEGETILFVVDRSQNGQDDKYFKILIDNGANINNGNLDSGLTILAAAAKDFNFPRIRRALNAGADPNIGSVAGVLPIVYLLFKENIKLDLEPSKILNILCAKTDLTKIDAYGKNIMHSPLLQKPVAKKLLLNSADMEVLNAKGQKPQETCWCAETRQLLTSREAVREKVVMPAMHKIAASKDFKNQDNFPNMPQGVAKLVLNRQVSGPQQSGLNRDQLTWGRR